MLSTDTFTALQQRTRYSNTRIDSRYHTQLCKLRRVPLLLLLRVGILLVGGPRSVFYLYRYTIRVRRRTRTRRVEKP